MEERIRKAAHQYLAGLGAEDISFVVEWPADPAHGDYATNAAMAAGKLLKRNPRELADELVPTLKDALGDAASHVRAAGPGFVNITLSQKTLSKMSAEALSKGETWGRGEINKGTSAMVEYTDPNPFKEMHIGHLMSNVIGESISRLVEFSGAKVVRANYQGDVGPHVAKALWGLQKARIREPATAAEIGKAYTHGSRAYEESPEAKAEIDAINRAVYAGTDRELMELWRKGRDVSLQAFEEMYRVLGTKFDYYFFESETASPGAEIVRDALTRGVFEESDGAVIYRGEKKGLHTLVFITSQHTPTYEAKEIGLAFLKEERYPTDRSIIITAAEQVGHFNVVRAALEDVAPLLGKKTEHVPHGFLRLVSGKMSSREGNVITAASLIEDVIERAEKKNSDPLVTEQVALGAIKYMILRQSPGADIIFDPEKSLSLEGDSGPYLQYALVRAKSVLAQGKAGDEKSKDVPDEPYFLERLIIRFPETVLRAERERAPHHVTQYLTRLAGEWNSFYAKERIIGGEHESHKLSLARLFVQTMENGLFLLGIPSPEKM